MQLNRGEGFERRLNRPGGIESALNRPGVLGVGIESALNRPGGSGGIQSAFNRTWTGALEGFNRHSIGPERIDCISSRIERTGEG